MSTSLIDQKKTIAYTNVAFTRLQVKSQEMGDQIVKFVQFLEDNSFQKNGPIVTATFGVEQQGQEQIIDMGVYIPVIGSAGNIEPYSLIEEFKLESVITFSFRGNPALYQQELMKVIHQLQEQSISLGPIYNAHINGAAFIGGEELIIDTYIQILS